jgi:hypothetical protein
MSPNGQGRVLRHGTTRRRGEAILRDGPDVNFREPGDFIRAEGFSAVPVGVKCPLGMPEDYAVRKASLFPDEGGPVIVEFEVPEELIDLAYREGGDVCFLPGWGLEELLQAWPTLPKRILPC